MLRVPSVRFQASDSKCLSDSKFQIPTFQVSSFRFQVLDFKFPCPKVSDFKFQSSSFRFQVSDFNFRISNFRSKVSDPGIASLESKSFGSQVSDLGFQISNLRFQIPDFKFMISKQMLGNKKRLRGNLNFRNGEPGLPTHISPAPKSRSKNPQG